MIATIPSLTYILLDFDGTLVDSESAFAQFDGDLLNRSMHALRIPVSLSYEEVRAMAGMTAEEKFNAAEKIVGFDLSDVRDDFLAARQAGRATLMRDMQVDLQEGVQQLLDACGDGCGIASNKHQNKLRTDLEYLGLMVYFSERIWGAEGRFNKKPAPDMLAYIAADLRCDPEKIGYVGDLPGDMQAAKAAGMQAIGFVDTRLEKDSAQRLQESGADFIIRDMRTLIPSYRQDEVQE